MLYRHLDLAFKNIINNMMQPAADVDGAETFSSGVVERRQIMENIITFTIHNRQSNFKINQARKQVK